jgi:hypothetical protein
MSTYNSIIEAVQKKLLEYTYADFTTKQKSITKLFPKYPPRVKAIYANGGVKAVEKFPNYWKFTVASGTKQGVSYDVFLRFKNIVGLLRKYVPNKQLWTKDGEDINYQALAPEIFNLANFEMDCTCPADLYWGPEYQKTKKYAQYGHEENRPPNIRNPHKFGIVCKHQGAVLERLPVYTGELAGWLKTNYADEVGRILKALKDYEDDINAQEVEGGA